MYLANNTLLQGGKYKIVGHISSGGFGNTYEGVHTMMDTRVAIKEFFPKMFCNRDENTSHITVATQSNRELVDKLRKKFIEEAKSIFKMNHPNIVKVHDIFEENGTAYYVMDYIDGKSLAGIVKQRGALSEVEAVGYIRQVADALKYVHSLNRLHLDIKPGNVMVDANGHAMLIDFGASKHYDMESGENTSTLMGVNTKGYAPVEQSNQGFTKFSPATDIYALGATAYKLLTGSTPPDANLLMAKEETLAPLPNCISKPTRNAVLKAMTLIRADRPQTIDVFLSFLDSRTKDNTGDESTICEEEEKIRKVEEARRIAEEQKRKEEETHKSTHPTSSKNAWIWSLIGIVAVVAIIIGMNNQKENAPSPALENNVVVDQPLTVENTTIVLTKGHPSKRNFVYTGEVDANGLPHGQGKGQYPETKSSGSCKFSGEYIHGITNHGEMIFSNGTRYSGTFTEDGYFKEGTWTETDGYYFKGTFKNGDPYNGQWYTPNGLHESDVVNGQ